jgi:hypothetical protein
MIISLCIIMDILHTKIDPSRIIKNFTDVPTNENRLDVVHPKRVLIDVSTDSFIKIIFQSDESYYLFVMVIVLHTMTKVFRYISKVAM